MTTFLPVARFPAVLSITMVLAAIPVVVQAQSTTAQSTTAQSTTAQSTIIAIVGEHPITIARVDHWITRQFPIWKDSPGEAPTEVRQAVAQSLVRRQFAMLRLLDLGDDSLQASIDRRRQLELQNRRAIDSSGELTVPELDTLAWETAWGSYLQKYLTEQNLKEFFESRRIRYDGTTRMVAQIFLPDQVAAEALLLRLREEIDNGERTFADVAREHSASLTAVDGGVIGWVEYRGDLPPTIAEPLFITELNQLVGPVRSPLGWHLLLASEQRAGTTSYETLKDHEQLRQDAANFLFERLVETGRESNRVTWIDETYHSP